MSAPASPRPRVLAAVLAAAAVLAFGRAVACGWIWDDDDHVTGNVLLRSAEGLLAIWTEPRSLPQWYPLVHTTFWLEWQAWGDRAAGYHALNVLLHALNAVLLWRVLRRLGVPGAWLGALLFAVHPVHAESVAWVTERKNVLSGAFCLGSLLAWIRWAGLGGDGGPPPGGRRAWTLSFLLFVAALLSKSVTATLPALALLVVWWKRGCITRRDIVPLLPFFAAGAVLGLRTAWMEREHVGAEGADWEISPAGRLVLAGQLLWFYASKLAVPWDLVFIYRRWPVDPGAWWSWLFPAAALGGMAALFVLRGRVGRGPLAAVLAFAGTLFPALGFLNVYPFRYSWAADHFQYLASAGLLALAGAGLSRLADLAEARAGPNGRFVPAPVPAVLAVLSLLQCGMYRDAETLWRRTLDRNPTAWMACNNLAMVEVAKGRYREAEQLVRVSLQLNPRHHEGWNNLGACRNGFKDYEGAEAAFRRAVELMPGFSMAWTNLGEVLDATGRPDEALDALRRGASFPGTWRGAHESLVRALAERKRIAEAAQEARAAAERFPRDVNLLVRLGAVLNGAGAWADAEEILREAARRDPGDAMARMEIGRARFGLGDAAGAAAELREAARLRPDSAEIRLNLGTALRRAGDAAGAEAAWREAVRLDPLNDAAVAGLAGILSATGRESEAESRLDAALAASPPSGYLLHARGALRSRGGRAKEAAGDLREAARLLPGYAPVLRDLAWLMATSADADVRAPDAAVAAAERLVAITKRRDPDHLDVLAAALASAGRFEEALRVLDEALALAPGEPVLSTIRGHAGAYRRGEAPGESAK
jgi:tetratricopeptide (TPR) repeat protein